MAKKPATPHGTSTVQAAALNTPAAEAEPQMSKMDAVRKALEEDPDITGKEGSEFVQKRFGLDVPANIFSQYRSTILKKQSGTAAAKPKVSTGTTGGIDRAAILAAKELHEKYGEDLESILDALHKYGEDGLREALEIVKLFDKE